MLVRDDVGKAKPTCYDLPHESWTYGRPEPADAEGAREVTMYWAQHVPNARPDAKVQDFRKINKQATGRGISNAKDLADYRRSVDVSLKQPCAGGPLPKVIPSDVIPSFAYGKKSRPSTPIGHVVQYQYCAEYEDALNRGYEYYEQDKEMRGNLRKIKLTKTVACNIAGSRHKRASFEQGDVAPPHWKMSKFSKVPPRFHLPSGEEAAKAQCGAKLGKSCSLPTLGSSQQASQHVSYGAPNEVGMTSGASRSRQDLVARANEHIRASGQEFVE